MPAVFLQGSRGVLFGRSNYAFEMVLFHSGIVVLEKKNVLFRFSLVHVCVCVRQHLNKTLHVPKDVFI